MQEEFTNFLHPEDAPHMKEIVVVETMEDIDKDKNGYISLEEYIGDMYRGVKNEDEPDWVRNEREQFQNYRDKNKDGHMDTEEVLFSFLDWQKEDLINILFVWFTTGQTVDNPTRFRSLWSRGETSSSRVGRWRWRSTDKRRDYKQIWSLCRVTGHGFRRGPQPARRILDNQIKFLMLHTYIIAMWNEHSPTSVTKGSIFADLHHCHYSFSSIELLPSILFFLCLDLC